MAAFGYIIRGGLAGRERLRVLSRALRPATLDFFQRAGIHEGNICLDAGCGGGDVSFELARLVGPTGRVISIDLDAQKVDLARLDAEAQQLTNVDFQIADVSNRDFNQQFDVIFCRFVLTHLPAPEHALSAMWRYLRPGGLLLVVDVDCDGHFWYPPSPAHARYLQLYMEAARRRGGDPTIGPRLASLLAKAGFENLQVHVVQPVGLEGEVKLISSLTMENIADSLLAEGLASAEEIKQTIRELHEFAGSNETLESLPRIFEVSGRRPK